MPPLTPLFAISLTLELKSLDSSASSCAGVVPVAGLDCVDGYWLINSSLSLAAHGFDIEGRIRIQGDFNLTLEGLLQWKGFAKSNDSFPDQVPKESSFVLSFVNVTGEAQLDGNILVDISPSNVDGIIGAVDSSNPKREIRQAIFEAANSATANLNISLVKPSQPCRKVSMSAGASTGPSGRTTLSALFTIDDSGCTTSKSTKLVKILVPIFVVLTVAVMVAVVIGIYKSPTLRRRFMPFASRKAGQRQGSITRYSSEAPTVEDAIVPLKGKH